LKRISKTTWILSLCFYQFLFGLGLLRRRKGKLNNACIVCVDVTEHAIIVRQNTLRHHLVTIKLAVSRKAVILHITSEYEFSKGQALNTLLNTSSSHLVLNLLVVNVRLHFVRGFLVVCL